MIVVSGVMRSGTTWLAKRVGQIAGRLVAQEPHNPFWERHGDYHEMPADLHERVLALAPDMHRHRAWHDRPLTARKRAVMRDLFLHTEQAYPGVGVLKVMLFPYWGAMLDAWPDLRVVYVRRRPQSWLSSVVRTPGMVHSIVNGQWTSKTPWKDAPGGELGQCLAFWAYTLDAHLRTLRKVLPEERFLVVDYEALSATAEVEAWRVAEFLGCDAGPLEAWTRIPERSWEGCPWGQGDVVRAVQEFREVSDA